MILPVPLFVGLVALAALGWILAYGACLCLNQTRDTLADTRDELHHAGLDRDQYRRLYLAEQRRAELAERRERAAWASREQGGVRD